MIPATSLRAVGATGVHVSALGVGTATFGDVFGVLGPDTAHQVVAAAVDAGLRYFDTAPLYGNGLAETRLGRALSDLGNPDVTISTKVGRMLDEHEPEGRRFDLSRDGIRRSLESSLVRLGRDRVDIVLLHDVDDFEHEVYDTAWAAVCELRDEGLVDAVGSA